MGIPCESCENHLASYWVEFSTRFGPSGAFAVCWLCMVAARRGPRPPLVTVMTETA